MDVFESGNFYNIDKGPSRPNSLGAYAYADSMYANANADSYANQYRAKYPVADLNSKAALQSAISGLQGELTSAQNELNKCPKENVWKAIFSGGLANLQAKNCKSDKQAKVDGISTALNAYQDALQQVNAAAAQAQQDAQAAAAAAAQAPVATALPVTGGGTGTMTWVLIGVGVLAVGGVAIWALSGKKKAAAAA